MAYEGVYALDLCQFFTALILHFGSLQNVRSGVQMCKFAIYNS